MAYNQKAWKVVIKYLPTHYWSITGGPCCDQCSRALEIASEAMRAVPVDDPEMDSTDFAHPAWWRGYEHSFAMTCREVNDILDGKKANVGTSTHPWQALRQRLYDIRTLLGVAERIVSLVEYDHNSKFYLSISQWYKVRQDYAKRLRKETKHNEPARN